MKILKIKDICLLSALLSSSVMMEAQAISFTIADDGDNLVAGYTPYIFNADDIVTLSAFEIAKLTLNREARPLKSPVKVSLAGVPNSLAVTWDEYSQQGRLLRTVQGSSMVATGTSLRVSLADISLSAPTAPGSYTLTFTATDPSGQTAQDMTLNVSALKASTDLPANAMDAPIAVSVGDAVDYQVSLEGCDADVTLWPRGTIEGSYNGMPIRLTVSYDAPDLVSANGTQVNAHIVFDEGVSGAIVPVSARADELDLCGASASHYTYFIFN